ncbi:MAG TPA: transcriptional regulator [Frankiaceae bacterium]|nr:transcriptional regulator [Frankiaceae bacterium]
MSRSSRPRTSSGGSEAAAPKSSVPEPLRDLVDLLGRRHALPTVWELRGPAQQFRVLVQRLGAPEAQVSQRLRELREAGLVEVDEGGDYRLTGEGRRLLDLLEGLETFANGWATMSTRQRRPRGAATEGRGEPPLLDPGR